LRNFFYIEILKKFLAFFLFTPKYFSFLIFLKKKDTIIKPFFGMNLYKTGGPYIRTKKISKIFGNYLLFPNIIYAQSYWSSQELIDAKNYSNKFNVPIIFNQNGWYYKGWYKNCWKEKNLEIVKVQKKSTFVIYQSKFCKKTSKLLNKNYQKKESKIIYNCSDEYKKILLDDNKNFFLLSGVFDINSEHILYPAILAFENLVKSYDYKKNNLKLVISGYFTKEAKLSKWYKKIEPLMKILISKEILEMRGRYSQKDFSKKFSDINFSLHLKYKDPCPNAVVEKMKLGIIHVYSKSGGTPELVKDAGLSIKVSESWNRLIPVNHKILRRKILEAISKKIILRKKVKKQARKFNYKSYIQEHKKIFLNAIN
jgi:hypothetical protein